MTEQPGAERTGKDGLTDLSTWPTLTTWLRDNTHRRVALIVLDIIELKHLNDQLGHHHGDVALVRVADALTRAVPAADLLVRASDEFVVVQDLDVEPPEVLLARVRAALADVTAGDGQPVRLSIGAADGQAGQELLRLADNRRVATYRR
jgi:diguanylate cyclase (GGDEF)-like protein